MSPDKGPDELTRRQWLLRLGKVAMLFEFSESAAGMEAREAGATTSPKSEFQGLPPGVYEASSEHMAHALLSDERYPAIPEGSETGYAKPRTSPLQPQFFTPAEFRVVERLVTLILGDPPRGLQPVPAKENQQSAGEVAEWIDLVVSSEAAIREAARGLLPEHRVLAVRYFGTDAVQELENTAHEPVCRGGLQWLEAKSRLLHAKEFLELEDHQQARFLELASKEGAGAGEDAAGAKFLAFMKTQTIRGFYTSRAGLEELNYKGNTFHVDCPGCARRRSS
jgi:hypothetical protein